MGTIANIVAARKVGIAATKYSVYLSIFVRYRFRINAIEVSAKVNRDTTCSPDCDKRIMQSPKLSFLRLFLLAFLINIAAQAIHETGHLLVYQIYGRNPTWGFIGLVQLWNTQPEDPSQWVETSTPEGEIGWLKLDSLPSEKSEIALIGAAGPLASLLCAGLGLFLAYKHNHTVVFKYTSLMLSLSTALTMSLYYLRSPLRVIGDEYDIAVYFDVNKIFVEIPLALIFISCIVLGLRLLSSWQARITWGLSCFLGSASSGILLMTLDGQVREAVNKGIPFFQSVMGYSMPVLIVYSLAFFCIISIVLFFNNDFIFQRRSSRS